jgi:hypothetical protein
VALIASTRLTPATQKEVAALLGNESMEDVAVWADDVRDTTHPRTASWHFTNIPISSNGFRRTRDCQQGSCVVAAIERQEAILRDRTRPRLARQEALKFLIHLIGDVHQPLHAGDAGDRGGNLRMIVLIGGADNLHGAWDSGIIQAQGQNAKALASAANSWLQTQTESLLTSGSAVDWANESYTIARDVVYPQVKTDNAITAPERQEALRIIHKRIARAGVRLAAVLNRAFVVSGTE